MTEPATPIVEPTRRELSNIVQVLQARDEAAQMQHVAAVGFGSSSQEQRHRDLESSSAFLPNGQFHSDSGSLPSVRAII
jgi:hypothetical protein